MNSKLLTLVGLLMATIMIMLPANGAAEPQTSLADLFFAGSDFDGGDAVGVSLGADGLLLSGSADNAIYTSPVLEAPILFNAVVPQWTAEVPGTAQLEIQLRTALTPGAWSKWHDIHVQPDWMLPGDVDIVGEMVIVPAVDVRHAFVQFSVRLSRDAGAQSPVLRQLRLTFIDSTAGPSAEQMLQQQSALNAEQGVAPGFGTAVEGSTYPRPTVISRQVWCTDPDCNYNSGMYYEPATHLIVHHTVSANENRDWAAVVRAIWRFHTYTRGWGDIGYNYLVDMDGVIYEGHNSQDYLNLDVIGTHAADANVGGMGVALIGTFATPEEYPVSATPPQPMLDAVAELLAWKADQRNIDVYDSSRMVNMSWGLPHLMGHRDVYGGTATTCPGGQAHALLPWLRQRVAERIGFHSPHIYVDESSDLFSMSDISQYWWTGPRGCGNNGHAFYTWSVASTGESTNWGEWRPNVPANGNYELEVYAPYCDTGAPETLGATYEVSHAHGVDRVVVSQNAHIGLWMSLGEFELLAGNQTVLRLTDLTSTDSGRGVWFDAVRLHPRPAKATNLAPAADSWQNQPRVIFSWDAGNPTTVLTTMLQVATDAMFNNLVLQQSWATGATTSYQHIFEQDYAVLYWRVLLTVEMPGQGNVEQIVTEPTAFALDSTAPVSTISNIFQLPNGGAFLVMWEGTDQLSGAIRYHVDFRRDGEATWVRWLSNTTATSELFAPLDPTQVYWFRTQGTDLAGNVELAPEVGQWNTKTSIPLPYAIMLPVVNR